VGNSFEASPDPIPPAYREETFLFWLRPSQFKANREDVLAFAPAADKIHSRYNEIKVPVVIVVGQKDPFGVIEQAYRLNKDISSSKLIVIPLAGHMIPQCHPHKVMEAIMNSI
jgi:pimeloyl-ACP methyl ester carboxylesterase